MPLTGTRLCSRLHKGGFLLSMARSRIKSLTQMAYGLKARALRYFVHLAYASGKQFKVLSLGFYLTHDKVGNPLQTEFGLSVFNNHRIITLQEKPEQAPTGELSRLIEIVLEGDLVVHC